MAENKQFKEDALKEKVQTDVTAEAADSALDVKKPETESPDKVVVNDSAQLKQQKVAKIVGGANQGGMSFGFSGTGVSGSADVALGTSSATPIGKQARANTRFGKKVEKVALNLNLTTSEQYTKEITESAPLNKSPNSVQGFNGYPKNDAYITQKAAGATPAEITYERSMDIIENDMVYFADGQQIESSADKALNYPTQTYNPETGQLESCTFDHGNYLARGMNVTLWPDGTIYDITFDTEAVNPVFDADNIGAENANAEMQRNQLELDREVMETKAGDETSTEWSPLPLAIHQSNQVLKYHKDLDSLVGAEMFAAKQKIKSALSFQLNKATKDGQNLTVPAEEFMFGNIYNAKTQAQADRFAGNVGNAIRSKKNFTPGSFIAMYDSIAKYNNKADLLLQPRGFRMHRQALDNNLDTFYVNPDFVKAYENGECFSTYDGSYDPSMPILMTDKCAIIHQMNLANYNVSHAKGIALTYDADVAASKTGKAKHTFLDSKHSCLLNTTGDNAYVYYKYTGGANGPSIDVEAAASGSFADYVVFDKATVNGFNAGKIEFIISTSSVTGFTKVNTAIPAGKIVDIGYIDDAEIGCTYVNTAELETVVRYHYSDQRNDYIGEIKNYFVEGIKKWFNENAGLVTKALDTATKYFVPILHSTRAISTWDLILAEAANYIAKERVVSYRDLNHYTENFGYPFTGLVDLKTVKDATLKNFSNPDPDSPLVLGKMNDYTAVRWYMPEFFWNVDGSNHRLVAPWYVCESNYDVDTTDDNKAVFNVDKVCMAYPSVRAGLHLELMDKLQSFDERDLRLSLDRIVDVTNAGAIEWDYASAYKYGRTTDGILTGRVQLSIKDVLSMPREIGFSMFAPAGLFTPTGSGSGSNYVITGLTALTSKLPSGGTGFRAYQYFNDQVASRIKNRGILSADTAIVTRGANYTQTWVRIDGDGSANFTDNYGIILGSSMAYGADGSTVAGLSSFVPFAKMDNTGADTDYSNISLFADMRYMYYKINVLPFLINPFDGINLRSAGSTNLYDIYDTLYMFGLCGFRASDYTEDVANRFDDRIARGRMYVSDIWKDACSLNK